jgi:acyl-CoA thioesterase
MCHGGFITTLSDSAFAFACNSHNQLAVAQHLNITFIASAWEGDRLTAEAVERSRSGRSGLYDMTVRNQKGEVIAEMRGASRTIKGQHFDPATIEETP